MLLSQLGGARCSDEHQALLVRSHRELGQAGDRLEVEALGGYKSWCLLLLLNEESLRLARHHVELLVRCSQDASEDLKARPL